MSDIEGNLLVGRFVLQQRIGGGPTGEVWRGHDSRTSTDCVIKLLHPGLGRDREAVAGFRRESRTLTELRQRNILTIRGTLNDGERLALVMDLIQGEDLHAHLARRGPLPPAVAVHLIAQVCDALAAAHAAGVGHLHVKPANVLLDLADAADPLVRVTDFGLTHLAPPGSAAAMMLQAELPDYIAPEVWAGRPSEPAGDVYAVGVMLYELVVGRTPFGVDPNGGTLVPPDGFPAELWWLTAACLSPDPAARPAMAQVADALSAALPDLLTEPALSAATSATVPLAAVTEQASGQQPGRPAAAPDPPEPPAPRRRPRRRFVTAAVMVAGVALLASVLGGLAIGGSSEVGPTANGGTAGPSTAGVAARTTSPGSASPGQVSATLVSASRLTSTTQPSTTTTGTTPPPSAATVSAPVPVAGGAPTGTTVAGTTPPPTATTAPIDWQCKTTTWNDDGTERPVTTCIGTDGSALYVSGSISNAPPDENEIQVQVYLGSNSNTYRSYTYTHCSDSSCQLSETVAGAVAGTYHSQTNSLSGSDLRFTSGPSPDLSYP